MMHPFLLLADPKKKHEVDGMNMSRVFGLGLDDVGSEEWFRICRMGSQAHVLNAKLQE